MGDGNVVQSNGGCEVPSKGGSDEPDFLIAAYRLSDAFEGVVDIEIFGRAGTVLQWDGLQRLLEQQCFFPGGG